MSRRHSTAASSPEAIAYWTAVYPNYIKEVKKLVNQRQLKTLQLTLFVSFKSSPSKCLRTISLSSPNMAASMIGVKYGCLKKYRFNII